MRKYLAAAALSLSLGLVQASASDTQAPKQESIEKHDAQKQAVSEKPKFSGVGFNSTQLEGREYGTTTASLNFLELPGSTLWFVGGHEYNSQSDKHMFDAGLKLVRGRDFVRGTVLAKNHDFKTGRGDAAVGVDIDQFLASYKDVDFGVLGDIAAGKAGSGVDYGIGGKAVKGRNTVLFLYSNRGVSNTGSVRFADIFKDEKLFAALQIDIKNRMPTFTGYFSLPNQRFIASYSENSNTLWTNTILSFGNSIPTYARQGFLETHVIATQRGESIQDSDYRPYYPAVFFTDPKGKVGNVLRFNTSYNTKTGKTGSVLAHNAVMIKIGDANCIVLTQKYDYGGKNSYVGLGGGYKIRHVTPTLTYQFGGKGRLSADIVFGF